MAAQAPEKTSLLSDRFHQECRLAGVLIRWGPQEHETLRLALGWSPEPFGEILESARMYSLVAHRSRNSTRVLRATNAARRALVHDQEMIDELGIAPWQLEPEPGEREDGSIRMKRGRPPAITPAPDRALSYYAVPLDRAEFLGKIAEIYDRFVPLLQELAALKQEMRELQKRGGLASTEEVQRVGEIHRQALEFRCEVDEVEASSRWQRQRNWGRSQKSPERTH